jgi:hypothetical protein
LTRLLRALALLAVPLLSCATAPAISTSAAAPAAALPAVKPAPDFVKEGASIAQALAAKLPEPERARLERGVRQVAAAWRPEDGDAKELAAFCEQWFEKDAAAREVLLRRFSDLFEQLDGHFLEMSRAFQAWSQLELGPQLPIDDLFAAWEPSAHVTDDLFANKLAFIALLNFPLVTQAEMEQQGRSWSRRDWAAVRLARRFATRPSAAAQQARTAASAKAEAYIAGYNLWMHHLLGPGGARLFPQGVRLITHWNLRDQIKASYSEKDAALGLEKQRLIRAAMERIVTQTIPQAVIDDPRLDWDPVANSVAAAPAAETELPKPGQGQRPAQARISADREPDTRYAVLFETFKAARASDADSPMAPTELDRRFQLETEISEERVVKLFEQILSSPLVPQVAKLIEAKLGRKLEPHDVYYAGFLGRPDEEELSKRTRARYPDAAAYKKDIPRLLQQLGFSKEKAAYLDERIVVDPARGAGHALQAARRSSLLPGWGAGDFPHLRTRISPGGMDYKGYNIAVHEMGHNVEQVFSLYGVDDTLLSGVPGTSFTEALAFTFQNRDLELLGLGRPDEKGERQRVLNDLWATWEIAGVALVDLYVWKWMYAHPQASAAELREATVKIARDLWNQYYFPVLGGRDSALLGIYSHMISSFFYLPNYPLGHLIAFQLEEKLKGPQSGAEFERVARQGHLSPDLWMEQATGRPVVAEPLLEAAARAIEAEQRAAKK